LKLGAFLFLFKPIPLYLRLIEDYIDPDGKHIRGSSYQATDTWQIRKESIPIKMKKELQRFSKKHGGARLLRLLEDG